MVQIIPAILATTEEDYKKRIQQIEESSLFEGKWVQIDLMDNKFVQNKSVSPEIIAKFPTKLRLEAHLMVEYPENWIDELVKTNVDRIIFPVEDIEGVKERINHIRNHGKQVGLSINPETSVSDLEPFLDEIDIVLVMSVHPGFQGQNFLPEVLSKIEEIKQKRDDLSVEVDGGISEETAKQVIDAEADYLVIGSTLFKYGNLKEGLERITSAISE